MKTLIAGMIFLLGAGLFLVPDSAVAHGLENHAPEQVAVALSAGTGDDRSETCCHHDGTCTPKPILQSWLRESYVGEPTMLRTGRDLPHPGSHPSTTDPPPPRL